MIYGMAWWASHGICLGLARCCMVYVVWLGMAWYIVWPGEVWHGIWYGLVGMVW